MASRQVHAIDEHAVQPRFHVLKALLIAYGVVAEDGTEAVVFD